jgi:hypothetical protein
MARAGLNWPSLPNETPFCLRLMRLSMSSLKLIVSYLKRSVSMSPALGPQTVMRRVSMQLERAILFLCSDSYRPWLALGGQLGLVLLVILSQLSQGAYVIPSFGWLSFTLLIQCLMVKRALLNRRDAIAKGHVCDLKVQCDALGEQLKQAEDALEEMQRASLDCRNEVVSLRSRNGALQEELHRKDDRQRCLELQIMVKQEELDVLAEERKCDEHLRLKQEEKLSDLAAELDAAKLVSKDLERVIGAMWEENEALQTQLVGFVAAEDQSADDQQSSCSDRGTGELDGLVINPGVTESRRPGVSPNSPQKRLSRSLGSELEEWEEVELQNNGALEFV